MRTAETLTERICQAVADLEARDIGVAFSGGVDSSLLAKICMDAGKNVTLLTVGFSSLRDIEVSRKVSEAMGLSLFHDLVSLEELEGALMTVLATIEFDRVARFENSVCFYYVFRLSSKHGIGTVLSANGIDELFCGYHLYRQHFGDESKMKKLMATLVETAKKDKEEVDKLSALFSIKYVCPFLSDAFVDYAMNVPLDLKIKSKDDEVRKHILREVALKAGVPRSAAMRAKKAFQYSSGLHKAIVTLARKRGFTKTDARAAGLHSEMEAYLKSLKESALKQARAKASSRIS